MHGIELPLTTSDDDVVGTSSKRDAVKGNIKESKKGQHASQRLTQRNLCNGSEQ